MSFEISCFKCSSVDLAWDWTDRKSLFIRLPSSCYLLRSGLIFLPVFAIFHQAVFFINQMVKYGQLLLAKIRKNFWLSLYFNLVPCDTILFINLPVRFYRTFSEFVKQDGFVARTSYDRPLSGFRPSQNIIDWRQNLVRTQTVEGFLVIFSLDHHLNIDVVRIKVNRFAEENSKMKPRFVLECLQVGYWCLAAEEYRRYTIY